MAWMSRQARVSTSKKSAENEKRKMKNFRREDVKIKHETYEAHGVALEVYLPCFCIKMPELLVNPEN